MPSFFVVPLVIAVQDHLGVVNRVELIAIDHLPLQVGVEPLDVSVVFRRRYVRELLVNALVFQV